MRRSKDYLAAAVALVTLAGALPDAAQPADLAAARTKAQALCENCHGFNGVATLMGAANLSGQQKEYLREQLRAFRTGRRQNDQMNVIAKTLSDADIENLSEWYASFKVTVEMPG